MSGGRTRGRPRSTEIPTAELWCDHHGQVCEHRQWRRGTDGNGVQIYRWMCAQRQNEQSTAAYRARVAEEREAE